MERGKRMHEQQDGPNLSQMADQLEQQKTDIRQHMGGWEQVERQHQLGKLTARERIHHLFDPGTFEEMGIFAHHQDNAPEMRGRQTPADGVITGCGKIRGRSVALAAYDFTVLAGSMGIVGERKVARVRQWALRHRIPMIWLIDSAGARIQELAGSWFAGTGDIFFEEVKMSGVVPQVCAVMGPGAAGTAYVPALADFVPMVKGTSFMALGGPPLVKAAIGEDINEQDLGGSKVHTELSGVADLEVANDEECLAAIRDYLSYFPSHSQEMPPESPSSDPPEREVRTVEDMVPVALNQGYDMHKVIREIVDDRTIFEMKPRWARNLITAFAHIGGYSVGIIANQPMVLGGAIDVNASDKAARFIMLCDAFNIPLVYLADTPAFMIGSSVEKQGIIRHGAKFLYATSVATVPKFTVIVRKAFGAGYYVMNGRAYEPDLIVAWPHAQISLMGAEGAVNILYGKMISKSDDPTATREELLVRYRERIGPDIAAGSALIDDIIRPRDTRRVLYAALERTQNKVVERPTRKHGIMPV